ncbi:MAG: zinc ABC transporter substrate-binding protein [Candidatus Nomurabacteria bacterium]|nr:MAG: zinc ABC transporter substrate-binding protein [Candidatus Nomurabacteria bacterium]
MKVLITIVSVAILGIGAAAWYTNTNSDSEETGLQVGATIYPLYDIVQSVAGDDIVVFSIVSPGASVHTYEPSPSVMERLAKTEIVFAIGAGLDEWVEDIADAAGQAAVVEVTESITLQETEEHEHEDEAHEEHEHEEEGHDHDHGAFDPHYWLDPNNAAQIAQTVAMHLSEIDPEHSEDYQARAALFQSSLVSQDVLWQEQLAVVRDIPFITLHDAFGYFADHFGLQVAGSIEPFPGQEPTPQYLADLQSEIEEEGVGAVFLEPQLNTEGIRSFADDTGIHVGVLDPLGGVAGRQSYSDLITFNIQSILETLQSE